MPEMPDVIGGETITSEWGNDIRDRTVQRYANTADRTASVVAPGDGDLSFLEDTGKVYVYYSGSWRTMYDDLAGSVAGYVKMGQVQETVDDGTITSAWETGASVTFSKPAGWVSFDIMVWGSVLFRISEPLGTPGALGNPRAGVRTAFAANMSTEILEGGVNVEVGDNYPLTIPSSHTVTAQTVSGTVAIQYRSTAALVAKLASTVHYMAIRTA